MNWQELWEDTTLPLLQGPSKEKTTTLQQTRRYCIVVLLMRWTLFLWIPCCTLARSHRISLHMIAFYCTQEWIRSLHLIKPTFWLHLFTPSIPPHQLTYTLWYISELALSCITSQLKFEHVKFKLLSQEVWISITFLCHRSITCINTRIFYLSTYNV